MADVTKEIVLEVGLKDSTAQGTQTAKQRLRELQKTLTEMALAGQDGTQAFKEMEIEAGKLKDQIGDTSQRIKNLASDTKNIDTFVAGIQGIAAGFQIAQGAAALFGDENEDLQKALLKVQGAMALANGVQQVANLLNKDSILITQGQVAAQKLYALAVGQSTGAMKLFRIALVTTGIGAIVVAIGLAAEAMGLFTSKTKDNTEAQKENKRALNETAGTLEYYERRLKANGATEADLARERLKMLNREKAILDEKLTQDTSRYGVKNDQYQNSLRQELELLGIKIKEENKIITEDNKAKADINTQKRLKRFNEMKEENRELIKLIEETNLMIFENELDLIDKKEQAQIAAMQREGRRRLQLATAEQKSADGQKRREADVAEAREKYVGQSYSIINDIIIASAGKSEAAQKRAFNVAKAASIAQAIVNTYLAVTSALTMKEVFPGQRFVEAGLALAAGLASVAKIKAQQFQGASGGGAPSADVTGGGAGASAAPPAIFANPQTTNLGTGELSAGQGQGAQPMRAYVVERDISQTGRRVRRLEEFATLS